MDADIQRLMANLMAAQLHKSEATREEFGAEMEVRRALSKTLEDHLVGDDPGVCAAALEIGHWDCDSSPIEVCVYDDWSDSIHDYCLYCNNPEERK
jgi:hypothetical protein